jgi:hypothetical protein
MNALPASGATTKTARQTSSASTAPTLQARFEAGRIASGPFAKAAAELLARELAKREFTPIPEELAHLIVEMAGLIDAETSRKSEVVRHIGAAVELVEDPRTSQQPVARAFAEQAAQRLAQRCEQREGAPIPADVVNGIVDFAWQLDQHTSRAGGVRSIGAAMLLAKDQPAVALCELKRCIDERRPRIEQRISAAEGRTDASKHDLSALLWTVTEIRLACDKAKPSLPPDLHRQIFGLINDLDPLSGDGHSFLQNFRLLSSFIEHSLQPVETTHDRLSRGVKNKQVAPTLARRHFDRLRTEVGMGLRLAHKLAEKADQSIHASKERDVDLEIWNLRFHASHATGHLSEKVREEVDGLINAIEMAATTKDWQAFGTKWVALHTTVMAWHHEVNKDRWSEGGLPG